MHYYLITTFQHGRYIRALLDSIEAQYESRSQFLRDARILVADDASTDHTQQVLADAQAACAALVVFRNPTRRGVSANRNFLLTWLANFGPTQADFVQFVDGGHLLPPGSLQARLAAFEGDPDLQCAGGQLAVFLGKERRTSRLVDTFPVDPDLQAIANLFECHFYGTNALFRASVFSDPIVRFPQTPSNQDWLFFALFPIRKQHVPVPTLLYRRQQHPLSAPMLSRELIADLRRQVRALLLLRIGLMPSARDCELLDLVGYLSFRMQWCETRFRARNDVRLPWFRYLGARSGIHRQWTMMRRDLEALFGRMVACNDVAPVFHPEKLRAYLAALVRLAQAEIDSAPTPQKLHAALSAAPVS